MKVPLLEKTYYNDLEDKVRMSKINFPDLYYDFINRKDLDDSSCIDSKN